MNYNKDKIRPRIQRFTIGTVDDHSNSTHTHITARFTHPEPSFPGEECVVPSLYHDVNELNFSPNPGQAQTSCQCFHSAYHRVPLIRPDKTNNPVCREENSIEQWPTDQHWSILKQWTTEQHRPILEHWSAPAYSRTVTYWPALARSRTLTHWPILENSTTPTHTKAFRITD